ncbi:glutathione S-transferase N-terminal domain-containing protein [bacterium]|nr:glutathione S-transferase N-terminal domain-containing protein [bacterium]
MKLKLYYYIACPFCRMVVNYLKNKDFDVEYADTRENRELRKELVSIGGSSQVPCLLIDGVPLYESNDIIQWFEDNMQ